jgi:hypothetical protein
MLRSSLPRPLFALSLVGLCTLAACADAPTENGLEGGREERVELGEVSQGLSCVTLRRNAQNVVEDAHIAHDPMDPTRASTNYGAANQLQVGAAGTAQRQALLRFDLGQVPANVTITSASLLVRKQTSPGNGTVVAHRISAPWSEASVTWSSFGGAFDATTLSSVDMGTIPNDGFASFDLTGLVQSWNNGSAPNNGVLLEQPTGGRTSLGASDATVPLPRPALTVCYAPASCSNGLLDGAETGLDCGGVCAPCNDPCVGVVCAASDVCHLPGVCNPSTGVCSNPIGPFGTPCNDGDACTQVDTCQTGVCVGASPVVCGPLDDCHAAGSCDASTGLCTSPLAPDGTSCDDGDVCTAVDVCQSGTCLGSGDACGTCSDGVLNQGESGVDCGGPCGPCMPLGNNQQNAARSCAAILYAGGSLGDGLYWVDPTGGNTADAYVAYCDMTTDGGGWTLAAYAGSRAAGFPRMDIDVGAYDPSTRVGKASKGAVKLARASNEIAFAYSPIVSFSGPLSQTTDTVAFDIPDPLIVDFQTTASNGSCVPVNARRLLPLGSLASCVGNSATSTTAKSLGDCNPTDNAHHAGVWSKSLGGTYSSFAYGLFETEYGCDSWYNVSHHVWVDTQYANWEPSATQHWPGSVEGATSVWLRCDAPGACPTCDDGVQNQGEDGVDCGWPCGPCAALNTQATAQTNCTTVLLSGQSQGDGVYWIDPNGGSTADAHTTYCDMTADGGGWTLVSYAGDRSAGFPRMDIDTGAFDPTVRVGKASRAAVAVAKQSVAMALGYSPNLAFNGGLSNTTDAVSFDIPDPSVVDFKTTQNNGACVGVAARRIMPIGSLAICVGTSSAPSAKSVDDCNPSDNAFHAGVYTKSLGGTYNSFAYGLFTTEYACNSWPNVSHHYWVDSQYYNWQPSATVAWPGSVEGAASVWLRGDVSDVACFDGVKNNGEQKVDCDGPCAPCPTCLDLIQNQGETGVDCGGPCGTCPFNTVATALSTCKAILAAGGSAGDGLYWVDPDGGSTANAYQTYCDMTTSGGGWTLVAYAADRSQGFPRMDVDAGAFHPYFRSGKASRSAVGIAHLSTEMALAYRSIVGDAGSLSQSNDAVAFVIPDPSIVDFKTSANNGACVGVSARRLYPSGSLLACVGASAQSTTAISTSNCNPTGNLSHAGVWNKSLGGTYSSFAYGLFQTEYACNSWNNISHHYWVDTQYSNWQPSATAYWPSSVEGSASVWLK